MNQESSDLQADRSKRAASSTLIEPFSQIKFGVYVIGASIVFVILVAALFLTAFYEQYQHLMGIFNITDFKDQMELVTNSIFYHNAIKIGALLLGYIVGMFVLVFKLTHRYYGPLVSIERFVDEIGQGKYGHKVKIRQKDELQRLADKLNQMSAALQNRHGSK
jgi:HAMP domain-containing protein